MMFAPALAMTGSSISAVVAIGPDVIAGHYPPTAQRSPPT
jgi:hypothetical protein